MTLQETPFYKRAQNNQIIPVWNHSLHAALVGNWANGIGPIAIVWHEVVGAIAAVDA